VPKFVAIMGGFLILTGIVMLGMAIFSFFGYLNVGVLLQRKYVLMFALGIVVVGLFDAFSAIIIGRWSD